MPPGMRCTRLLVRIRCSNTHVPAVWVAVGLIIVVAAALMWIVHLRSKDAGASPAPVSSAIVQPLEPDEA